MKNYFSLTGLCLAGFSLVLMNSCKKDSVSNGGNSMKEEFDQMYTITQKGWVIKDNTVSTSFSTAPWSQGVGGTDKTGATYGFVAYSYKSAPDEYAYSAINGLDSNAAISSWLITPSLFIKNGVKISFYTRGDESSSFTDRMQVLLNHSASTNVGDSANTVGDFTTVLFDINATQTPGGYPQTWTKYEYTFTGIPEKTEMRIAFRHYVDHPMNARGVGIDLFQYQDN
jgi:hypothetical protein